MFRHNQAMPMGAPEPDRLGVLTSTLPVAQGAPQVILDGARIAAVAEAWAADPWPAPAWDTTIHWADPHQSERTLNWLLLLDALNFCFWPDHPDDPRWQVAWDGQIYNGYNALAAALTRAVAEGQPLWDATFLAKMDDGTLAKILRPAPNDRAGGSGASRAAEISFFPERIMQVREVGEVLLRRFGGQFSWAVASAHGDAVSLALLVAREFPSFRDLALWEGQTVYFYKRAQILVADIAGSFQGQGPGAFSNLGDLTAFADYKVPQLLRRLGILEYTPDLARRIESYEPIHPGWPDEVALRAATVWGVEWLRQELARHGVAVTPSEIDMRLWLAGQTPDTADRPYHRTRTIFY